MNPNSVMHRSSSGMQLAGGTPGDCGSCQTGAKFSGKSVQTRWMRSLHTRDQATLVASFPMW